MGIEFAAGRAGCGKSRYVMQRIKTLLKDPLQKVVVIVPEQYTFQMERDIIEGCGIPGFLGLGVFSFKRLVYRILEEAGGRALSPVSLTAKSMMVRLAIRQNQENLQAFKKSAREAGFDLRMAQLLSELKRYDITPEQLTERANDLHIPYLKEKILDIAGVYQGYGQMMQGKTDMEDLINLAIDTLENAPFLQGAHVIIDGFDMLTRQIKRLVQKLMQVGESTLMTFRLCPPEDPDAALFAPEDAAFREFYAIAREMQAPVSVKWLPDEAAGFAARHTHAELAHLEKNLYAFPYAPYLKPTQAVSLFAAANRTGEVLYAAENILRLVREQSMRFRDIAVFTDTAVYGDIMKSIFLLCGIPCFIDGKRKLSQSCAAVLIDSALALSSGKWHLSEILRHIKTGLTDLTEDEADVLLNYQKEYGIRGFAFKKPFLRSDENIECIRQKLVTPLLKLEAGVKNQSAAGALDALQAYLQELSMAEKIEALCKELEAEGLMHESLYYAQTADKIAQLLHQARDIFAQNSLDLGELRAVIASGLDATEIGVIPPAVDEVTVGDITRSRVKSVRALFVLGLNEGVIPPLSQKGGIITEDELSCCNENGLRFGRTDKMEAEKLTLYAALVKPKESLFCSYCLNGGGLSTLADKIKKLFPLMEVKTDTNDSLRLLGAQGTFSQLAPALRDLLNGRGEAKGLPGALAWYRQNGYGERLEELKKELAFAGDAANIGNRARALYGGIRGSVSRIEEYYRCPFMHFVKYGLKAKEQKDYEDNKTDAGSLMHGAIDRFTKKLKEKNTPWQAADDTLLTVTLGEAFDEALLETKGFAEDKRLAGMVARYKKELLMSVKAVRYQMENTDISIWGSELRYGAQGGLPAYAVALKNGEKAYITGCIDRADRLQTDDGEYLRVVDYKLSGKKLDYGEYFYGLNIQLIVYLMVLTRSLQSMDMPVKPAGAYYFSFALPYLDKDGKGEEGIYEQKRMDGITLDDTDIIKQFGNADAQGRLKALSLNLCVSGEPQKNSAGKVFSAEEFESLFEYTHRLLQNALEQIYDGVAPVSPSCYKKAACEYCAYGGICRFDESYGNTFRKVKKMGKQDLVAMMAGGDANG
jgi:ATP-dependent helicase/nuclease subunit B